MRHPVPWGRSSWVRHASLLCGAALLLAGCTDEASSPAGPSDPAPAAFKKSGGASSSSARPPKYRDSSLPHATGRSGTARLAALALLGPDGLTRLTLTTGDLDDPAAAPGHISKAQVKIFSGGRHAGTLNFHDIGRATTTLVLPGLGRLDSLRVQANVRGVDGRRTDVVTVTETVKLGPSLHVAIDAPERIVAGVPTPVTALVTETAGDVGTRADCELYAGGVLVDRAEAVWVDAGDAVTCLFTYTPSATGDQRLEVRVRTTDGELTGPVSSTASDNVSVVAPGATVQAEAQDRTLTTRSRLEYSWRRPDGATKEYSETVTHAERAQTITVTGALPRAAAFPLLSVELAYESAGGAWHTEAWTALAGTPDAQGRLCNSRTVSEQGAIFFLCTTGSGATGATTFGYTRFAGTVTYRAAGFIRTFDAGAGPGMVTWNDGYTTYNGGGQIRPWGNDVTVRIRVTDAQGTFGVEPVIPLAPFERVLGTTPRTCELIYHYWLEGGAQETCTDGDVRETGRRGAVTG